VRAADTRFTITPDSEHGIIAGFDGFHGGTYLHHTPEIFMADDQFMAPRRRVGAASLDLFPVSATNTDLQDLEFDFIVCGDLRFRPLREVGPLGSGGNGNSFHISILVYD
jgi:hypothetical protein